MPVRQRSLDNVKFEDHPKKRARIDPSGTNLAEIGGIPSVESAQDLEKLGGSTEPRPADRSAYLPSQQLQGAPASSGQSDRQAQAPVSMKRPSNASEVERESNEASTPAPLIANSKKTRPCDFLEALFPPRTLCTDGSTAVDGLTRALVERGDLSPGQDEWHPSAVGDDWAEFLQSTHQLAQHTLVKNKNVTASMPLSRRWTTDIPLTDEHSAIHAVFTNSRLGETLQWDDCHVFLAVGNSIDDVLAKIQCGVEAIRKNAIDRRFVLFLAFFHGRFVICRYDALGLVTSPEYEVHSTEGARALIHFLCGITCLSESWLGKDNTIFHDSITGHRYIQVGPSLDQKYRIEETVFIAASHDSRWTFVLRCRDANDQTVAVKDSWVGRRSLNTEPELMERARAAGISESILQLKGSWLVPSIPEGCDEDNTARFRILISGWDPEDPRALACERVHRRIVLTPYALPMEMAENIIEVLSAMKDAVEAHERLVRDVHILHRDISPSNIMLGKALPDGRRRGLLIDLDLAIDLQTPARLYNGLATGTAGFMDPRMVASPAGTPFDFRWDVTGCLLVLMYWVNTLEGPRQSRPANWDSEGWSWRSCSSTDGPLVHSAETFAEKQWMVLKSEKRFTGLFMRLSTEYTGCLHIPMLKLRKAVVDNFDTLTHQVFIGILDEEIRRKRRLDRICSRPPKLSWSTGLSSDEDEDI